MAEPETVELLDELGFSMGCIVETIVATRNPDGSPNAAPMGVTRSGPVLLEIKPFKLSTTHRNLLNDGDACVNITGNPGLFLATAFKHELLPGFDRPDIDENLRLRTADASITVESLRHQDVSENRSCFACTVRSVEINRPLPKVFSRGRAEAIEAIIHATRIEAYIRTGRLEDAETLNKRFKECRKVVEKVSIPSSIDRRVIRVLDDLIKIWGGGASR